jgi:hypothetical protein
VLESDERGLEYVTQATVLCDWKRRVLRTSRWKEKNEIGSLVAHPPHNSGGAHAGFWVGCGVGMCVGVALKLTNGENKVDYVPECV